MELVRSYRSTNFGLPTNRGGSAPALSVFGACSAFTHVTACTLAKSPSDPLHQRLQQSRCLHCCSDCYRVERTSSRAGLLPLWTTAFHGAPGYRVNQDFGSIVIRLTGLASTVLPRLRASTPIAPLKRPSTIAPSRLLLSKACAQPGRWRQFPITECCQHSKTIIDPMEHDRKIDSCGVKRVGSTNAAMWYACAHPNARHK